MRWNSRGLSKNEVEFQGGMTSKNGYSRHGLFLEKYKQTYRRGFRPFKVVTVLRK